MSTTTPSADATPAGTGSAEGAPGSPGAARPERGALGLVLLLGGLTAIGPFSIDTYLPAMPQLARELGASAAAVQLTLSSFFLGLATAQLVWGALADRIGRRTPLLVGLALYVVASVGCAFAPSVEWLVAGRFLQAVGGSTGLVVARALVRDRWSGRDAARIMSLLVLVMGIAPILAPSLGSVLLAVWGWRAIFAALVVFGVLAFTATRLGLPSAWPERAREPVLRGVASVLRDRLFLTSALGAGLSQAGMFAYIAGSSFVFVEHHGLSPTAYAWLFGVNSIGLVAASQLNRRALLFWEPGAIARTAMTAALIAAVALRVRAVSGSLVEHAVLVFLFVASYGLTSSNATALALEHQHRRAGMASAVLGSLQYAVSALATVVVGLLSDGTARGMATVMLGSAALAVLLLSRAHGHAQRSRAVAVPAAAG
jgi:DHA1 family bicyclomycin/chloramphenicol resistance-like MFS transporter